MLKRMIVAAVIVAGTMALCGANAASSSEIPKPAPLIATGGWAGNLQQHPHLLGSKSFLQGLAKAKPQEYSQLKGLKSKDQNAFGIMAAGAINAVEGLPKAEAVAFVSNATKNVGAGVTNDHQDTWVALEEVALTYDLLYEHISPADRAKMIAWFNGHLGKFTIDENAFHNSTLSKINCYLKIAYATWNENPKAKEFRDYALVKLYEGKVLPVLKQFGAGGGFTECGWYTRGSLWHLVQGLEMARRFEKYDGFALAPGFFYRRMAYELYQPYPGLWQNGAEQYPVEGDGANTYGLHVEYPRFTRTILAQYFRGSELSGYVAVKDRNGSNAEARLIDFVYEEPKDAAKPASAPPLAHLAGGIGKVYARSDWKDDATWMRFECGPFFSNHQHFEVGNFEIFRYEPLATESGEYSDFEDSHSVNYLSRTVAHNCILVYNPAEKWPKLRDGGRNNYGNDGGQTNVWGNVSDTVQQWLQRADTYNRGQIVAYEDRPEYLYVAGNCTKAYSPDKLNLYVRQIVFLRPGTFVIFDRVQAKRANFPKAWLLHCRNEPEISGNKVGIKSGKGEMYVETLLPKGAKINKVKGYSYPSFAGGESYPAKNSGLTSTASLWRMEVTPGKPAEEDLFLHVISTHGQIEAKATGDSSKLTVQVPGATVTFSGKCGGEVAVGGKSVPMPQKIIKNGWE